MIVDIGYSFHKYYKYFDCQGCIKRNNHDSKDCFDWWDREYWWEEWLVDLIDKREVRYWDWKNHS